MDTQKHLKTMTTNKKPLDSDTIITIRTQMINMNSR